MIRPLCVILPQMSGYIKHFDNGGKTCHLKLKMRVFICNMLKFGIKYAILNVKDHSQPIYDDKYIKTKVKTFNNTINTLFSGDEIPNERIHYICISAICIDSVLKTDKKNYPQIFSEQCKYKIKKRELVNFIDDEVDLSSDNDSDDSDE